MASLYRAPWTTLVLMSGLIADIGCADISGSLSLRERVAYTSGIDFDQTDEDKGWNWAQRLMLVGEWDISPHFQLHGSLLSALQEGREPNPVNRNHLDVQTFFLASDFKNLSMKVGRQELIYGSQRLIASREGTNVRRNWDALRADVSVSDKISLSIFGAHLVDVEPNGVFNDTSDSDNRLYGLYATKEVKDTTWETYLLQTERRDRRTIQGAAEQKRYTTGLRYESTAAPLSWDWELIYQWGSHGALDIDAWSFATRTYYSFDYHWKPLVGMSINVASGDKDPFDNRIETFDALFPRGNYFSNAAILGPGNFYNINPSLSLSPSESIGLAMDVNLYWQLESTDGVYGPPGNLISDNVNTRGDLVNIAVSFGLDVKISRHLIGELRTTYSMPREVLQQDFDARDDLFFELTFIWRPTK